MGPWGRRAEKRLFLFTADPWIFSFKDDVTVILLVGVVFVGKQTRERVSSRSLKCVWSIHESESELKVRKHRSVVYLKKYRKH
jgi:hypothetical protein